MKASIQEYQTTVCPKLSSLKKKKNNNLYTKSKMSDNFPQYLNEKHLSWKHGQVQTFPDYCQCTSLISLFTLVTQKPQKYDYKSLVWRIELYAILNHV